MAKICTIFTVKQGEFQVPFINPHQFSYEIEEKTGVLACSQEYYYRGKYISLSKAIPSICLFQMIPAKFPASRYFIRTPTNVIRVNVKNPSTRTLRSLLFSMKCECEALNCSYPSNQYTLFHKSMLLEYSFSLSNLPHDSTLDLQQRSTYPLVHSGEITIYLRSSDSDSKELTIGEDMCVEEIKKLYYQITRMEQETQELKYNGIKLEDNRSLESYRIKDQDTLTVSYKIPAGCYGCSPFVFNNLEKTRQIQFSPNAPKWRVVRTGLSWRAICRNNRCEAYKCEVICDGGFGVFELSKTSDVIRCPMCKENIESFDNCGFYRAKWKFKGKDQQGNKKKGKGAADSDSFTTFADGDNMLWKYLRIEVSPLDYYRIR